MSYTEAIDFLYSLRWFGAKLGLQNTFRLAELAGNPERALRFIHVAGTNGKGSTCAMLDSIYRATGLRVGLFTSPHLVAFGERIQINRKPIPKSEVPNLVTWIQPLLKDFSPEEHPTFFEVVTVMALRYFVEQNCELVVWETGLGGRLDATNIVTPIAGIITNIQYDHQKWLGETLASIATEKAGIIKPGVPVITGTEAPEALQVIEEAARERGAPLTIVRPEELHRPPLEAIEVSLLGQHQRMNAAVAVTAVQALAPQLPVAADVVRAALKRVHWPGRLQLVTRPSGQRVLLDGAHNVGGAGTLAVALREYFPEERPALVLGILRDKDWPAMCALLAPMARRILLVPVHSERTAEPHGLAEICRLANPNAPVAEFDSLHSALADAGSEPFVTIAGSLYLIGEAMEELHLSPAKARERALNEWSGIPAQPKAAVTHG